MLKAVLFDMDGVIFDSEPIHFEVDKKILKDMDAHITDEELSRYVGTASRLFWSDMKEKHNLDKSVEELMKLKHEKLLEHIISIDEKRWPAVEGVKSLIANLGESGLRMAVASSSSIKEIEVVLGKMGIRDVFEAIAGGNEVKNGKPAPDVFELAAERLKLEPSECLVIEDSCNGVEAAKKAGMKCIGYLNPNSGNQDLSKADMVVKSLTELDYNSLVVLYN